MLRCAFKFKGKISVQKEVNHSFYNHFLHVTWYELTKMVQVGKTKLLLFDDPLIVFVTLMSIYFLILSLFSIERVFQRSLRKCYGLKSDQKGDFLNQS